MSRERLTLVATILGSTVVFLDATVVNVALPAFQEDLEASLAGQQWVVEAYMLALVSLLLVGGSLGDQFGRRRLFMLGLSGFAVTSVLCALAPTTGSLIAARALQGLAGALLVPGSLAILAATFEGERRGWAVGTWTAWSGIATVLGPAGGGFLVESLSWRWIFWVNLPLIAITLLITARAVDESRDPAARRGLDLTGIVLSAVGLAGPVFALIEQPGRGWGDPVVLVPMILGVLSLAAFVAYESRTRFPMLPLALFRIRNFAVTNLATLSVYAGLIGGFFFITLFLQQVAGYTALEAGLATTPVSLLLFALSPRFGALAAGVGPRLPMAIGPMVAGVGLLLLLRVDPDASYASEVLPALVVFGVGLAATVAPLTTTVLDSVEAARAGIASGINNAISRVAGLLAIAVLGAVIAAQVASALDERTAGRDLGPAALAAVAEAKARTLAGSDLAAGTGSESQELGSAIEDSSESGFHLGVGLAGGLLLVGGLISALGIRNPERPTAPTRATEPGAAPAGECGRCPEDPVGRPEREALEPVA